MANVQVNYQYSRHQNKILTQSGDTPSIYSGSTSAFTEEEQMVLGNFTKNNILDGELCVNTFDNKLWYRSNDEIIELACATGTSSTDTYVVSGFVSGNTLTLTRNDVSGSTVDIDVSALTVASLSGLTDVNVTSVTDGQVITYNSTTGLWDASDVDGIPDSVIDSGLTAVKVLEQAPENTFYTDAELLVSAQDLVGDFIDAGSVIDMDGNNLLGLYIDVDVNDSTYLFVKLYGLTEIGGDEFEISHLLQVTESLSTDRGYYYEFDIKTIPFIQVKVGSINGVGTAGDVTINFNKKWHKDVKLNDNVEFENVIINQDLYVTGNIIAFNPTKIIDVTGTTYTLNETLNYNELVLHTTTASTVTISTGQLSKTSLVNIKVAGDFTVEVETEGAELIDGEISQTLYGYDNMKLYSKDSNWFTL